MSKANIKGFFKVKDSDLIYYPQIKEKDKFPHSVKINGKWHLDTKNNLIFEFSESYSSFFGRNISFEAKVENVSKNSLSLSLSRRINSKLSAKNKFSFKGRWKIDRYNNLIFDVKRNTKFDELIFGNNWVVTGKNQIAFFCKKKFLKKEIINSFVLCGSWRLSKNTLFFSLENSSEKELEFSLALERKLVFNKKSIDFLVGGESGSRKKISLFGKCKFTNNTLEFSADFGGRNKTWIFGYRKAFGSGKEAMLELINEEGKPLGVEVTLSKKIFKDATLFLKVKALEEKRVEAGFYLPF